MNDEHLAALLAGQTAMVATICELLIERGVIDRAEICDRLQRLLEIGAESRSIAPIRHLIDILERGGAAGKL
jgi:hypothetical protein